MTPTHPAGRARAKSRALLFALITAIAVLGCGGATTDLNLPNVVGAWQLSTVNGKALPGTVQQSGDSLYEIVSDGYMFNANGSYSETGALRSTIGGVAQIDTLQEAGAWALGKTAIALSPVGSAPYGADIGTGTLTFTFGTLVLVYTR